MYLTRGQESLHAWIQAHGDEEYESDAEQSSTDERDGNITTRNREITRNEGDGSGANIRNNNLEMEDVTAD